jgi:sarcosine oxidase subunit beta
MKYSLASLVRNAFSYHENWQAAWRNPEPKEEYDVIIVGGGGHGLATAYYLAKEHGITNVAVLEKGWIGGGNTGPQHDDRALELPLGRVDASLREVDEALGRVVAGFELQRDVQPAWRPEPRAFAAGHARHRTPRERQSTERCGRRMLDAAQVKAMVPIINTRPTRAIRSSARRCSVAAASRATMRWRGATPAAPTRAASTSSRNARSPASGARAGQVVGVDTTRGPIKAKKIGVVAAGHSSVLASMVNLRLPIESHPLQALVSEPIKPVLHTVVMSGAVHGYISQSDKGDLVIGAGIDHYTGYGQRGSFSVIGEHARRHRRALSDLQPRADEPPVGRHRRRVSRCVPDHRNDAAEGFVFQLRMGQPAASRRHRVRAGCSRTRSRRTGRTS